ncbi:MAG: extracellular solute-binding protein [Ancrocorticia sp.]
MQSRWARVQLVRFLVFCVLAAVVVVGLLALQPPRASISVLCSNNPQSCQALAETFEWETGHRVQMIRLPTSQAHARLRLNTSAPEFDVWMGGPAESYVVGADEGLFDTVGDLAAVAELPPELRDGGGYWAGIYGGILSLCINTDRLGSRPVPDSWQGLLDPELTGEVLAPHPLLSGTAATMLTVQYGRLGSLEATIDYLRALENQLLGYLDSGTDVARNVARGSATVGISFAPYCEAERAAGYPVTSVFPREGTGYEVGAIALLAHAANPEIARLFIDFVVSAPGQRLSSSMASQLATSPEVSPNLVGALDELTVPLVASDRTEAARLRPLLINLWAKQVRHGIY